MVELEVPWLGYKVLYFSNLQIQKSGILQKAIDHIKYLRNTVQKLKQENMMLRVQMEKNSQNIKEISINGKLLKIKLDTFRPVATKSIIILFMYKVGSEAHHI